MDNLSSVRKLLMKNSYASVLITLTLISLQQGESRKESLTLGTLEIIEHS